MPDVSIVARGPSSLKMRFRPGLLGPPLSEDDFATQAQAEAGTDTEKVMSPLRTKQQIDARRASQAEAEAGSDAEKISTPLRVAQQTTARITSQAVAEAGTDNDKLMTPLRAAQQIDARLASQATAEAGIDAVDLITSLTAAQATKVRAEGADYTPAGVGAIVRTIQAKLRGWFHLDDYDTAANARTAAAAGVLIAAPTINSGFAGATTRKGLITGHIRVGQTASAEIDAHVGLHIDEVFTNTGQEVRGATFTMRNLRTTADEPTLGWDFFGAAGVAVVDSSNTQYIRGSMKGVVGETYAFAPLSGTYKVKTSYPLQAVTVIGATNVTLESWYGLIVGTPVQPDFSTPAPTGSIETAYGIRVQDIPQGSTDRAAMKIDGTGTNGQIKWVTFRIVPEAAGVEGAFLGKTRFGGLTGSESVNIAAVASAVNHIEMFGGVTANRPVIRFTGTDTDVGAIFQTKGAAGYLFYTGLGAELQAEIEPITSATTRVMLRGGTATVNARVKPSGNNLHLGTGAAIATTATAGMVTLPAMAGTPTGVPLGAGAGEIPAVVDTAASKLWLYIGGAWKSVTLT